MPCPLIKKRSPLSQEKQLYILYDTVHLHEYTEYMYKGHQYFWMQSKYISGVLEWSCSTSSLFKTCYSLLWSLCNNMMVNFIFK